MSEGLISIETRQVFREYLAEMSLRFISDEFDAAKINCDTEYQPPVSGQRRVLVEQYYHTVNWTDSRNVKKVLQVFENVLHTAAEIGESMGWDSEFAKRIKVETEAMISSLRKDGFHYVNGKIVAGIIPSSQDVIKKTMAEFHAKHFDEQIRRMNQSIETDPALAIGTAKELIENCCKMILADCGKPQTGTPEISSLTEETLKELKLVPDDIPDQAKGREAVKCLLSNLATIGRGLAEIRSLYDGDHGKDGKKHAVKPRHAKLAVGAATMLTTFLFETHKETKSRADRAH